VIVDALSQRMPVYIEIPAHQALMPVVGVSVHGVPLAEAPTFLSNAQELDAVMTAIMARLATGQSPVILSAFTIAGYGLQRELEAFLAATGIPFATTGMSKGSLSESHPLYLGMAKMKALGSMNTRSSTIGGVPVRTSHSLCMSVRPKRSEN